MTTTIEFFFDFSSPYSYLAAVQLTQLAEKHHCLVDYKPTLLGAIFKLTGQAPLTQIPLKGPYSQKDFARSARFYGLEYRHPDHFPISTVYPARAVLMVKDQHSPEHTRDLCLALFRAYFVDNRSIDQLEVIGDCAEKAGLDRQQVIAATVDERYKIALKNAVEESIARGVFGAPFMVVGEEAFWGADRLQQLDKWLAEGGF